MSQWTNDQTKAIHFSNCNILVSAGAGSGKTSVLSERVITKLKEGISIDKLLILTFTKLAAQQMRNKIRKNIKDNINNPELLDKKTFLENQLEKLDSAYISTFDSFALSLVKKYHYLLDIDKDIQITDENIIKIELIKIIEQIFDKKYLERNDKGFLKCIENFFLNNDKGFRDFILNSYQQLTMKIDKREYIEQYFDKFNTSFLLEKRKEYFAFLQEKIENVKEIALELLDELSQDQYQEFLDVFNYLLSYQIEDNKKSYEQFSDYLNNFKMPSLNKNKYSENTKNIKSHLTDGIKELKEFFVTSYDDYINSVLDTNDIVKSILDIIQEVDDKITNFKKMNNFYTYIDIAMLSIQLVKSFDFVREELKNQFHEIMIDEYQDTSDIQETFINYIANNNVYMVGDIKQSIYRFRNANPNLFKDKYLKYSQEIDGKKIDLKENFRSRKEVLSDINLIFSDLMTLSFGGADYVNSHQMIYANHAKYDNNSLKDQDQHMEILSYQTLKGDRFKEGETEAFIIAYDIKNKIENKFQVYDEETKKLRNATYSDFVILIDRGDSFSLYKKIFEYFKIPLSIYKDEKLEDSIEISLILNIMQLMQKVKNKEYDKKFKFLFMSIARSFLYETLDNDILLYLMNKNYKDHPLMKSIYNVLKLESIYSIQELQYSILKEFGFYEYWMKIGNLEEITIRLAYLDKYAKMFDSAGYTIDEYINFLEKVLDEKMSIRYSIEKKSVGSCKIMTIHNSKGLQFPICYYSGLNKKFNNDETKKELYFSDTYGIIIPSLLLNKKDTFLKKLYLYNLQKEDLSEKLRLFYVALTRCEEKIIIVTPELKEETKSLHCFADFLTLIQNKLKGYIKLVNLNNIKRTDKYDIIRNHNFDEIFNNNINDNIEVNNSLTIASFENVKKHYSKVTNEIISTNTYHNMQYGTKIHEILEHLDLKNPNIINEIDALNITNEEKKYLNLFLKSDLIKNIDKANVYQEYHFVFQDDGVTKEGIIDLMLEYDDYIHIIDYKLKNVNDDAYINQLNGYKNYISHIKNKPINLYLYSIEDGIIKEIH